MDALKLSKLISDHMTWLNSDGKSGSRFDIEYENIEGAFPALRNKRLKRSLMKHCVFSRTSFAMSDLSESMLYRCVFYFCTFEDCNFTNAALERCVFVDCDFRASGVGLAISKTCSFLECRWDTLSVFPNAPMSCPDTGEFIGWKKARFPASDGGYIPCIVKLRIPEDALRSSAFGRKCRCNKAYVEEIQSVDGSLVYHHSVAVSRWDLSFRYPVGEMVEVKNFDQNRYEECTSGIHFFINRQEAVDY